MSLPVYFVDTFTRTKDRKNVSGNPAVVFILNRDDDIDDKRKQEIAAEINQPVTVFLSKGWTAQDESCKEEGRFTVSWFTVTKKLNVCGHGAVGAAVVVFKKINPGLTKATFKVRSGQELELTFDPKSDHVSLNLPSEAPGKSLCPEENPWLKELIHKTVGSSQLVIDDAIYSDTGKKILLAFKPPSDCDVDELLRDLRPDLQGMMGIVPASLNIVGVGITIQNDKKGNGCPTFFSRFFAPWFALDEDQVCGSLHAMLTPYWSSKLGTGDGQMLSRFSSPRSGDVHVRMEGAKVWITGQTVMALEGTYYI